MTNNSAVSDEPCSIRGMTSGQTSGIKLPLFRCGMTAWKHRRMGDSFFVTDQLKEIIPSPSSLCQKDFAVNSTEAVHAKKKAHSLTCASCVEASHHIHDIEQATAGEICTSKIVSTTK